MQHQRLSVLVTTLNEAQNLPGCLESVRWAEDVLVVDSGSQDATVEIARESGARVVQHAYESAGRQKNWGLSLARHPWVLILDADERVTPELESEIRTTLAGDDRHDGYFLRRRSFFLGREIRHCGWDRDRVLRLFKTNLGRYDDRLVHEKLVLEGRTTTLGAPLLHHSYRSFSEYLDKLERYTTRGANDLRDTGRKASWWDLLLRPPARFVRMYGLQLGFLDGKPGFLLCVLSAFSVWLKYARLHDTGPQPVRVRDSSTQTIPPTSPSLTGKGGGA